jgi:hypothetical protein
LFFLSTVPLVSVSLSALEVLLDKDLYTAAILSVVDVMRNRCAWRGLGLTTRRDADERLEKKFEPAGQAPH